MQGNPVNRDDPTGSCTPQNYGGLYGHLPLPVTASGPPCPPPPPVPNPLLPCGERIPSSGPVSGPPSEVIKNGVIFDHVSGNEYTVVGPAPGYHWWAQYQVSILDWALQSNGTYGVSSGESVNYDYQTGQITDASGSPINFSADPGSVNQVLPDSVPWSEGGSTTDLFTFGASLF